MIDRGTVEAIIDVVIDKLHKDYIIIPKSKPMVIDSKQYPFLELALTFACEQYNVPVEQVKANNRKSLPVAARQLYFYLAAKYKPKVIGDEIAAAYVNKCRTMIINTKNQMIDIMSVDKIYNARISEFEKKFNDLLKQKYDNN